MLRIAEAFEQRSLSPLLATSVYELDVDRLIFDALVTFDERGNPVPDLAVRVPTVANGDVARDGRSVTYRLRRGVKWQDGAPFTSADVAFTARAIVNPNNTVIFREGFDRIASIATPDPYTIVFRFNEPYPPAVATIFGDGPWAYGILPRHLLARYRSLDRVDFFADRPVGTGPFKLSSWQRGNRLVLVANDRYFLGPPKLRRIEVYPVTNAQTELLLLRNHQIDWYPTVPASAVAAAREIPGIRLLLKPQNRIVSLVVNVGRGPLRDRRVRRALAAALDRDSLVTSLTKGTAQRAVADIAPIVWAYPAGVRGARYDLAQASRLFDAAGWRMTQSGFRENGGRRLAVGLVYPVSLDYANLAVAVQQQLRRAGVDVELRQYPRELMYGPAQQGGVLNEGNFDLAVFSWASGLDPDDSFIYECKLAPPLGNNYGRYCSSAMDAAQRQAMTTVDSAERRTAYDRIERLAVEDAPQLFLWWPRDPHAVNDDFKHFAPNPVINTWNAYRWDI